MEPNSSYTEVVPPKKGNPLFEIDTGLMIWTWVSFLIAFFILAKFAWKPVLKRLNQREKEISGGLENARKAAKMIEEMEEERKKILILAQKEANRYVENAKRGARELAERLQAETTEKISRLQALAEKEIEQSKHRVMVDIKKEVSEVVMIAVSKILDSRIGEKEVNDYLDKSIKLFESMESGEHR